MDIESILKLGGQLGVTAVVLIMVLKFLFKIVEKKFQDGENAELKNLKNNIEINNSLEGIAKNVDKVSHSQEKISNSQTRLVTLMELTYKRINGDK